MASIIKKLVGLIAVLMVGFVVAAIGPIDDTPLSHFKEVQTTYARINKTAISFSTTHDSLRAGWSMANITPAHAIDMAGYGPRGPYTAVHDSLKARVVVLDHGDKKCAIISVDLIMFPRHVRKKIYTSLAKFGFTPADIYLAATHTHSGFGNFEPSFGGSLIFGKYDEEIVDTLVQQITGALQHAMSKLVSVEVGFLKINAQHLVQNRLDANGATDPFIRVVSLKDTAGQQAMIVSFAAHAVNMDADSWELSGDYPGALIDDLEEDPQVDFAMFAAGDVASHSIRLDMPKGPEKVKKIGRLLSSKILHSIRNIEYKRVSRLSSADIPIDMPPAQLRISKHLMVRDWLYRWAFGPLSADIKFMEIGDILLVGMPCDYSGELATNYHLDSLATAGGHKLMITSFNGNYVGYITDDRHYANGHHDEVTTMNWVGPHKGIYFTNIIMKGIEIFAHN